MTEKNDKALIIVTHKLFFFAGWLQYIFIPIGLGYLGAYDSLDAFGFFARYFDIENEYWIYFLLYSFGCFFAYYFGGVLHFQSNKMVCHGGALKSSPFVIYWLAGIYLTLLLAFAWESRLLLGAGYTVGVDVALLGPLCTLEMILLFHVLYERFVENRLTFRIYSFLLVLCSFVLLSMGARLAVLSAIVSLYFQWWNWGAISRKAQIRSLKFIASVPLLLSTVGMWRQNDMSFDLAKSMYYLLAEPIGVAISAVTIFTNGGWVGFVDFRDEFWINFYNIVPSIVWPNKAEIISEGVAFMADKFEQPFGATSIVASSISYFGFVGGLIFFAIIGAFMSAVNNANTFHGRAYYCFLIGLLPFVFFRDPFQVQFKYVITGALMCLLMRKITPFINIYNDQKESKNR
jgi:hypothetical protein